MDKPEPFKNLTDLAEFLKTLPDNDDPNAEYGFDMRVATPKQSSHPCGSACCIGGWIQVANPDAPSKLSKTITYLDPSIPNDEAYKLCWAWGIPDSVEERVWEATPQQAARAVEILRDTGKCDWARALNEVPA